MGVAEAGYNERLFSGSGLRRYYHFARYHWLRAQLAERTSGPLRVIEIGCFDGRAVEYVPDRLERYVGLDANWEDGLDIGRKKLSGRPEVSLIETTTPAALKQFADGSFNVAVALETLEHIPTPVMREYLAELARVTDGLLLVSVPNEMGPVFLAKFLVKRLFLGWREPFTFAEVVASTLRRQHKVARREHKGFSYAALIDDLRAHFDIVRVTGVPNLGLPPSLSLTVGIVARSRRR